MACASSKLAPSAANLPVMQQRVPGITIERVQGGFALYKVKCAACHRLYAPSKYTLAEWNDILKKMFRKAKVTDASQQASIKDYVYALSK